MTSTGLTDLIVASGGGGANTTINAGSEELVLSGGTASTVVINTGGRDVVASGGALTSAVVSSGGTVDLFGGAIVSYYSKAGGFIHFVSGPTFEGGSIEIADSGYTNNSATLTSTSLTDLIVASGGVASATTIDAGAGVYVAADGQANFATVDTGGRLVVASAGSAADAVVNSGGTLELSGSGFNTTLNAGAMEMVSAGGSATQTTLASSGQEFVLSGGSASFTTIHSGGGQYVENGGVATSTTVSAGGTQTAYHATAIATTVAGGQQNVLQGGIVRATLIDSGGKQVVTQGTATGTTIAGGEQDVGAQSIATSTMIASGGLEVVSSGGTASATTIDSGGLEVVASGGTATSTTIDGGTLDLASGAIVSGGVTFNGFGTLKIENVVTSGTSAFSGTITGFAAGDVADLTGLAYGSGAAPKVKLSGSTLTVSNGKAAETFTLANAKVSSLVVAKDGTGGTLLFAPAAPVFATTTPGAASEQTPFAGVTLTDPNPDATDTLSIAVTGTGGTLASNGLTGGTNGVYKLTAGSPSAVTTDLDAVTFRPKAVAVNGVASTTFTLTDASSIGTQAAPEVLTQTIGNGNGVTIFAPAAGQDTITGNGSGDEFVFNARFGDASVTDFWQHLGPGSGHDAIVLPSAEFANFATLLKDTTQSGTGPALITAANGDQLALPHMTVGTIEKNESNFFFEK